MRSAGWAPLLAMLLLGCCSYFATSRFLLPFPSPNEMHRGADRAVEDLAFLSLGLRRFGADMEFIRLLQYYGTPETAEPISEAALENGYGRYFELFPRTLRLLDLDPFFSEAALFSAGALAFNLNRPQEAAALLAYALRRDPTHWRYHAYLAAIGYQKSKNPDEVIRTLEPFLGDPECPTLVKNVVAFLMRRAGRLDKAERVYKDILQTTRDPNYKRIAERSLREIEATRKKRPEPGPGDLVK